MCCLGFCTVVMVSVLLSWFLYYCHGFRTIVMVSVLLSCRECRWYSRRSDRSFARSRFDCGAGGRFVASGEEQS